ncbi:B-box domain protein [Actinidia chinensis var. chinensis]|uniref:B-box domain protein n=1 Tax=Actinidia chinensis var. chinensis TaxID=1590841 RepID=A0A2R6QCD8_ACTCC|nr:B-box domain protein [Actinidia chinensis var. chinensis]
MCRGREEGQNRGGFRSSEAPREAVSAHDRHGTVACELCESPASVYCQADEAFLCRKCDKWVHGANFLAQRHIRCLLCSSCHGLTQRYLIGTSTEVLLPTIVSTGERGQCSSDAQTECSRTLKMPFLFL